MKFVRPINDPNPNVTNPYSNSHKGTDYGYPAGTPVYASADGVIVLANKNETRQWIANSASDPYRPATGNRPLRTEDYGNFVKIDHGETYATLKAHMKPGSILVNVGQKVTKGQKIGEVGSTGNSTGNHVHWEVRKNDVVIDPAPLLDTGFTNYGSAGSTDDALSACLKDREKFWKERDEARAEIEKQKTTIANLNQQISDRNGELITANSEIVRLTDEVLRLEDRLEDLTIEANKLPDLNKQLEQALHDRQLCLAAEGQQQKRITELEKSSYLTVSTQILVSEVISRILHLQRG
jgi:septal ring factor EnvC (AmiA/AmiB activator)